MSEIQLQPGVFVATIKPFTGSNIRPASEDKNHLFPIILDVVAGTCPNKRVLAGTVAMRAGMHEGKTYLCKFEEIEATEYGRQFRFSVVVELTTLEILESIKTLGMPNIVEVVKNEPELTKSGNYSYPKGFTLEERLTFDAMTAEEQDVFIEKGNHPSLRVHSV